MSRWYMGFNCFGKPQTVVDQIAARVSAHHLGKLVPVARVEKKAGWGRFCLFLGVDSLTFGEIPAEVQAGLLNLPSLASRIPQPFTFGDIRSMVSGELDVRDYAQRLAYWRPSDVPEEDPFAPSGNPQWNGDRPEDCTPAYDRLLAWLSAVGSGSWERFREACHTCLPYPEDGALAARTMRQLRLLGHVEASPDGKRWCIAPPVIALASDPTEGEYAFLCGQHDPAVIAALDRDSGHESLPQVAGSGPQLIRWREVEATWAAAQMISAVRTGVNITGGNVALHLAQALPPIAGWTGRLTAVQGAIPELYRIRRFNGEEFVDVHSDAQSGLYQFWPLEEGPEQKLASGRPVLTAFYDAAHDRWLRGDWYGLRFLSRLINGEVCPANYEAATGRLAIPRDWRWPELYERALVLASGRLPERNGDWLIYRAITPQMVAVLARKLLNLHSGEGE